VWDTDTNVAMSIHTAHTMQLYDKLAENKIKHREKYLMTSSNQKGSFDIL